MYRCIIQTSALDAMYYDVISVRVRVRILVQLMYLIHAETWNFSRYPVSYYNPRLLPQWGVRETCYAHTAHIETQARTVSAHAEQTTMSCQFSTRVHCISTAVRLPTHGRRACRRLTGNWDSCDVRR